jgi:carbamoyltransferase
MTNTLPVVMGLNCAHDAAACLLIDGQIKTAIAEERLTRKKHQEFYPQNAIKYCLEDAGLRDINAVNCIVINQYADADFTDRLSLEKYRGLVICNPSHHLLHAYYAWVASRFDETAILIVDGSGYSYGEYQRRHSPHLGDPPPYSEMEEAESLFFAQNGDIKLVDKRWGLWEASKPFYFRFPSLGHLFSMASQYIFGDWVHAGKTMGLAPYGDPRAISGQFIKYAPSGLEVDTAWVTHLPPRSSSPAHLDKLCCDLAAKVQDELEEAMLFLANRLYEATRCDNLCISGGVALNSVANGRILREGSFRRLFVTPAAGDNGISIGAALYGYHELCGSVPKWDYRHDFHGRTYSAAEVAAVVERNPLILCERMEDGALHAARDIAAGKIIGWFEGGSELGPRALGHRSILCDARDKYMKDRLNATIKFREPFRPYAASVLSEHAGEYFDLDVESPFMLVVAPVHEDKKRLIPSVCHVDGTCRVQTVLPAFQGKYRRLLEHFYDLTGSPLVLDTSFNVQGDPIVETPLDALRCFMGSNMDAVYFDNYRVTKIFLGEVKNISQIVPVINDGLTLINSMEAQNGGWMSEAWSAQKRNGIRVQVGSAEFAALRLIDGRRTIAEINNLLPETIANYELKMLFSSLQRRGLISFLIS